ncbi:MarR family winged helix-turn-helix transcriptional regulator [Furfurilactobacillus siliginis]|uniref:HTH marR-type domain-containing protein n=1 Tax=Furfurilactobacillus siliginis TaxID=348151 RepID=A0A0R2L5P8_9LACO|nr:MarR family transcriptional regulator [Furfurilactobacillus siliginis]KRN97097.1 hypothetical protein IV55_GL000009 [Furfurilactobacillus siliginis]GEK29563.1 hypothetical protein LSI01_18740 [Furfurilactobacillus siliginis]
MAAESQEVEEVIAMFQEGYLDSIRSIMHTLDQVAAVYGVGWSTLAILFQVNANPRMTVSELSACNKITKGAVSLQITELLNRGLIRLKTDPKDRRRHVIVVTPKGQELAQKTNQVAGKMATEVIQAISLDGMKDMHKKLSEVAQALSKVPLDKKIQ